jgi:hypothetical protein
MYRSSTIDEDLALKQVIADRFTLSTNNRGYSWREVLPTEERSPSEEIIVTRGKADSHFSLEDVADAIGDSLADLLISRHEDEKSIFSEVNRAFFWDVAHSVRSALTRSVMKGDRLRLSESDLYLLIEKALLENEAYDVAKSLAFRRSFVSTNTKVAPYDSKNLTENVRAITKDVELDSSLSVAPFRSRQWEKPPSRPFKTAEPQITGYKNTDIGFLAILEHSPDVSLDHCEDDDL